MPTSRRKLLSGITAVALGLPLAACGAGIFHIDPNTTNIIQLVSVATRGFCGVLPTAETISKIILALALPSGLPAEQIAATVAHQFCDALPKAQARNTPRRGVERSTGNPIIDYGSVVINGTAVNIATYR
jgi:hypothetical protein